MGNGLKKVARLCGGLTASSGDNVVHYDADGKRTYKVKCSRKGCRKMLRKRSRTWVSYCSKRCRSIAEKLLIASRAEAAGRQLQRVQMEIVGSLTKAGEFMLEQNPCAPGEIASHVGRLRAKFDEMTNAEHELSHAYIRLREIVGAMHSPSVEPQELWKFTEDKARAIVAEREWLRSFVEQYRTVHDSQAGLVIGREHCTCEICEAVRESLLSPPPAAKEKT